MENIDFPNYKPTQYELNKISSELRKDKIASIVFAIIWNIVVFFTINALVKSFDVSNPASFIAIAALLIFVISGIYLILATIKKIQINLNELSFSSGFILKTWVEENGTSNNRRIEYYADIELDNKYVLNRVEINYDLWAYRLSPVVLTLKDKEIICVTLREVYFNRN